MNNKFDINKVIEHYKLDPAKIAILLYSHRRFPKQAFDRVLKNETQLDVNQLQMLANYIGVPVEKLFNVDSWKGTTESGTLVFVKGEYKAKLNYNGVYLVFYKNEEVIKQIIQSPAAMTVENFINYLNSIIKTLKNGHN